ncbi:MAG TPA: hypothetical protein DCL72_11380, partial [Rhizobiales bacterium]|nr:hypothetical protein [Hyphomicrobiales bacterium]
MTITLYDVQPSPHARKVRLLAAELGIKLTKVACDPRIGETRTAEYLAKNPNGRVPTLRTTDSFSGNRRRSSNTLPPNGPTGRLADQTPKPRRSSIMDLLMGQRSRGRHRRARLGASHQAQGSQPARQRPRHRRRR